MNTLKSLKRFSFGIFALLLTLHCTATHNRGGHISYKRIAPFTKVVGTQTVAAYTYSITVTRHHNQGNNIADRCADTVYFGDGDRGAAYRINGSTCSACGSTITCGTSLSSIIGGKVSIYTIQHTYPGPGSYLIRSFDPNRNPDIVNIANSINQPSYIESLLNISAFLNNDNSIRFQDPDAAIAYLGQCFNHTPVITEADGDSLSFEVTTTRGFNGTTVAGYFYPDPGPGGTYGMWAGWLYWCNPQQLGLYSITYIVKEWRKNNAGVYNMVGYVLRDLEVSVLPVTGMSAVMEDWITISPNPARDRVNISN